MEYGRVTRGLGRNTGISEATANRKQPINQSEAMFTVRTWYDRWRKLVLYANGGGAGKLDSAIYWDNNLGSSLSAVNVQVLQIYDTGYGMVQNSTGTRSISLSLTWSR